MKIAVAGLGRVGTVVASGLAAAGHEVLGLDIDHDRVAALREGNPPFYEPGLAVRMALFLKEGSLRILHRDEVAEDLGEVVVVTVGTPEAERCVADLHQVRGAVSWIKCKRRRDLVIAMKSTVPPGTGFELMSKELLGTGIDYVSNPEFLREGQALRDWDCPDRIVIGAGPEKVQSVEAVKRMHAGIDAPLLVTDITSAEMVKYASNAFLATRISFINEIAALCDTLGASIDDVSQGLEMDSRTGSRVHAGLGYGGSCLRKDVEVLYRLASAGGVEAELLRASSRVNNRQRLLPLRYLRERFNGCLAGLQVAVLGLAFKPDTDDVRDAPALDLIRALIGEGANVRAFDPEAGILAKEQLPSLAQMVDGVEEATAGAQAVCLVTEWEEIVGSDWTAVARRMVPPLFVFDGRNALDPQVMHRLGFEYVGIGRNGNARTMPVDGTASNFCIANSAGSHNDT